MFINFRCPLETLLLFFFWYSSFGYGVILSDFACRPLREPLKKLELNNSTSVIFMPHANVLCLLSTFCYQR